jgi:hypothetical protein
MHNLNCCFVQKEFCIGWHVEGTQHKLVLLALSVRESHTYNISL